MGLGWCLGGGVGVGGGGDWGGWVGGVGVHGGGGGWTGWARLSPFPDARIGKQLQARLCLVVLTFQKSSKPQSICFV